MKSLNKDNFDHKVLESENPVLVDFWSEYCMQCLALKSTIKKLEIKYPNINFYSANISDINEISIRYGIMSLPTVIIFKDSEIIHKFYGNLPQETFEKELDKI